MQKAGVVGLGHIGGGVAVCLARAGMLEAVYDIRKDASTKLAGVPPVSASPAEVARRCDTVLIAVIDAKQTKDALTGPDGILSQARPGLNVVTLSTLSLPDLESIRKLTDAAGVGLVDSGVSGGKAADKNGLVCFVGAKDDVFKQVKPVLDGFALAVAHLGGPGSGMAGKIARNVIAYCIWRAGYEAGEIAKATGLDLHRLVEAIDTSAQNTTQPTAWLDRPVDAKKDADEARIREGVLNLLNKDLDAALDLGKRYKLDLALTKLTRDTGRLVMGLD